MIHARVKQKTMIRLLLPLSFLFLFPVFLEAQGDYSTRSKKAIALYEKGYQNYSIMRYDQAVKDLKAAIRQDRDFIEPYFILADISRLQDDPDQAIDWYLKSLAINPDYHPEVYLYLAELEIKTARYREAEDHLLNCLDREDLRFGARERAEFLLKCSRFALEALKNPVPFEPVNLGDSVNSELDEYWPSMTADGEILVFTRLIPSRYPSQPGQEAYQEDFFTSRREDTAWSLARNLGPPVNTLWNEGAQSLSADGQYMFFAACNRSDGLGSCDIYMSRKTAKGWSEPVNPGPPLNTGAWESQPSVSPDGLLLYFVSNREGGEGGMDIWVSRLNPDGSWGRPENLGKQINTPENENSPFIHFDNRTLYFSSDGHPGMGGFDIFRSRIDSTGNFSEPENMGYPINTHYDETGLVVNAAGDLAYYASDRLPGKNRDLYMFELYPEARPDPVTYLKGVVFDVDSRERLTARFELIDLASAETVMEAYSDRNGEFLVCLPANRDYALNVSCTGYLFYSDHFALTGEYTRPDPFIRDIPLTPIRVGETTVLNNIFFEFDSDSLLPSSRAELDKLVDFLTNNPALNAELGGHTDWTGPDEYNERLSMRRARAVYLYLVNEGLDPERLSYKGYGERQPVADNETEEGRALNRRTELKITGIR